jgi:hypothetical protein
MNPRLGRQNRPQDQLPLVIFNTIRTILWHFNNFVFPVQQLMIQVVRARYFEQRRVHLHHSSDRENAVQLVG